MNIESASRYIQRLNQPFDVIISKDGIENVLFKNYSPSNNDVDSLLNEVFIDHNPDKIIVWTKKRNGSTIIKDKQIEVENQKVSKPSFNGFGSVSFQGGNDFKDYIIGDLRDKVNRYESKITELEKDNDKLKHDNFELEKEKKFKDKEFELSLKERDMEQTSGLQGIVETVTSNPQLSTLAAVAIGRLMGVDMNTMLSGATEEPQQPQQEVKEVVKPANDNIPKLNQQVANYVSQWIFKLDQETIKSYFDLMRLIIQEPERINDLLDYLKDE